MSATKNPPEAPRAKITRTKSRKTAAVEVVIPGADLAAFQAFADHFGFSPETVIEHGIIGQLTTLHDDAISSMAYFDEMPPVENPVVVKLHFLPDAKVLMDLVASLLNRPLDGLLTCLARCEALTLTSDMEGTVKNGGIENCKVLEDGAKRVMAAEFEACRGRMFKEQDMDAWQWLNLERFRPSSFSKGGAKP